MQQLGKKQEHLNTFLLVPFTCLPLEGHILKKTFINFDLHRTGNVQLIKKLQELGLHHPRVKKLKEAERKTSIMVNTSFTV